MHRHDDGAFTHGLRSESPPAALSRVDLPARGVIYLTQQKDAISKVGQADAEFQEIGDAVSRAEMLSLLDEQDRRMGFKESVLAAARLRRESNRLGRPRSLVDTSQLDVSALPGACAECATNSLPSSDHGHQHKSSLLTTDHPKVEKSSSLEAAYLTPSTITPEMIRAGVEALFSFYSDEIGQSAPEVVSEILRAAIAKTPRLSRAQDPQ